MNAVSTSGEAKVNRITGPRLRSTKSHCQSSILASLAMAPFVFVRRDGKKTPIQTPYMGPYRVLELGDKTYTINYGGIDRLKPVHTDLEAPVRVAAPMSRATTPKTDTRASCSGPSTSGSCRASSLRSPAHPQRPLGPPTRPPGSLTQVLPPLGGVV